MTYRIFLFAALVTYCLSATLPDVKIDDSIDSEPEFGSDMVDGTGSGYSFFTKQNIETRPFARSQTLLSNDDLSAYMQGSALNSVSFRKQSFTSDQDQSFIDAFNDQPSGSRLNLQGDNFSPRTFNTFANDQPRQPSFAQNDFSQVRPAIPQAFGPQSSNFASQNVFGNQQQNDLRTIGSQQILLPQNDLNSQQNKFANFGNQQQDLSLFQKPQQTWSSQQNVGGFSSSFGGQRQQPVSSGFFMQSNQQNDRPPVTNTAFMSSPVPTQRQTFKPQRPTDRFNGW